MKQLLALLALLFVSIQSHALVADRFTCTLKITDDQTKTSSEQTQDVTIARLPTSKKDQVEKTTASSVIRLKLDLPGGEANANVNFYYQHAVRFNSSNQPVEARQMTCMALASSYCEKTGTMDSGGAQPPVSICTDLQLNCIEIPDPFDPIRGWSPAYLHKGIPLFNEKSIIPVTSPIRDQYGKDRGTAEFSCKFQGTYL